MQRWEELQLPDREIPHVSKIFHQFNANDFLIKKYGIWFQKDYLERATTSEELLDHEFPLILSRLLRSEIHPESFSDIVYNRKKLSLPLLLDEPYFLNITFSRPEEALSGDLRRYQATLQDDRNQSVAKIEGIIDDDGDVAPPEGETIRMEFDSYVDTPKRIKHLSMVTFGEDALFRTRNSRDNAKLNSHAAILNNLYNSQCFHSFGYFNELLFTMQRGFDFSFEPWEDYLVKLDADLVKEKGEVFTYHFTSTIQSEFSLNEVLTKIEGHFTLKESFEDSEIQF